MKAQWMTHHVTLLLLMVIAHYGSTATIDFERINDTEPFEGLSVSNQFQPHFGVRFVGVTSDTTPTIARKGPPGAAYGGNDAILETDPRAGEIGDYFLYFARPTDPKEVRLLFDSPVSYVSFLVLDFDFEERIVVEAYEAELSTEPVIRDRYSAIVLPNFITPADHGSSQTTFISVAATNRSQFFARLDIRTTDGNAPGGVGGPMAFDNFTSDPAILQIEISESVPTVRIGGLVGRLYSIEYTDVLGNTGGWLSLTNLFLPHSPYIFSDTSATNATQRFYRAISIN